jgi:ABC-type nitrate/sulfonate/bicarbonate transport system substrate-binding protein
MTDLTEIRVAGGAQGFNWLPVFIAEEEGLFDKHGLKVEYLRSGTVDKATSAVRDGIADLAITPPEGAISDYIAGGTLRVIASNALRLPMSLVARPDIESLVGLRGARIGTSSLTEGTAIYTQIVLSRAGLVYPGDYEFVLAGMHTSRWDALQAGEIDCAPQPAPWSFLAERDGYRMLCEINDAIPEILFAAIIGTTTWTTEHRDAVERLLAALAEAHDLVNDPAHDALSLPIYQRITTPEQPELAQRGFTYTRDMKMWPLGLATTTAALATTAELMVLAGLLDPGQHEAAAGVLDPSFLPVG